MTLRNDLIAARALIDTPEKWCKGIHPTRKCAMYAVEAVTGNGDRFAACGDALGNAIPTSKLKDCGHSVVLFNDAPFTTHADIMALFDRAITAQGDKQ